MIFHRTKNKAEDSSPNWAPFVLAKPGEPLPKTRPITTPEGVGDRLRITAFAEIQAREAFAWGAQRFLDAPTSLRNTWRALVQAEQRHFDWLMTRMSELGIDPAERPVSDALYHSLMACTSAREFAIYIASAEERGRQAGERFRKALSSFDPTTAGIFGKIADEEVDHVRVATQYYDFDPSQKISQGRLE